MTKTIEFDVNIESIGQDFVLTSYQCAFNVDSEFINDTSFCFEYIPSTSQLNNTPLYGVGCDKVDGTRKIHFASSAGIDTITNHSQSSWEIYDKKIFISYNRFITYQLGFRWYL